MTEIRFTEEQKEALLRIARETGAAEIGRTQLPNFRELGESQGLTFVPGGVFVSFHIGRYNRGCIGCFCPTEPLWRLVQTYAVHACHDSRFPRMTPQEFATAHVEVSCLSVPIDVTNPLACVVVGTHGVSVEYKGYRGTYLPQVAPSQGWDTPTLLKDVAYHKAGIPRSVDVLHDPKVHWQTYTATVVSE